jgi:hypothetical protein
MDAKKKAEDIKEEDRENATIDYIKKAAENQKEAGKKINSLIDNATQSFDDILKGNVGHEDYNKLVSTVAQVNSLINQAKNGSNIDDIIKNLEALK